MNRGLTWTSNEVRCLLDIWADDNICQLLQTTHKNSEVFKIFSQRLKEKGYERTTDQCRTKVKKLRQQYQKVKDALRKTGGSGDEKDKCPLFDELDEILGTRPTVSPVDLVESHDDTATPSPNVSSNAGDVEADGESSNNNEEASETPAQSTSTDEETIDAPQSTSNNQQGQDGQSGGSSEKLEIPGARARKRKAKTSSADRGLQSYMTEQRKQLEIMYEGEQKRQKEENEAFDRLLRAQHDAEERLFQAMQAQQQAQNQMFMQLMGTVMTALSPAGQQQHPQPSHWSHPAPSTTASAWPMHHSPVPPESMSSMARGMTPATMPMSQQLIMPPPIPEGEVTPTNGSHGNPPVSSILHDTNQLHFYNM